MIETIERDYYKVTFVRDPLSRMLSAYRDKFTGDFFLNFGNTVDILCQNFIKQIQANL